MLRGFDRTFDIQFRGDHERLLERTQKYVAGWRLSIIITYSLYKKMANHDHIETKKKIEFVKNSEK